MHFIISKKKKKKKSIIVFIVIVFKNYKITSNIEIIKTKGGNKVLDSGGSFYLKKQQLFFILKKMKFNFFPLRNEKSKLFLTIRE